MHTGSNDNTHAVRTPSRRTKLAWCIAAPVLAAALLEFAVAAFDAAPRRALPMQVWNAARDQALATDDSGYMFVPGWLWQPMPAATVEGVVVNGLGFRGPEYPIEPAPQLRIVVLGESTTFGMGVEEQDCWPRQLESLLRERGVEAQVLNFGVVGHTLAQGVELFQRYARRWRPDVVVACYGGMNEAARVVAQPNDGEKIALLDRRDHRIRTFLERFASVRWAASLGGRQLNPAADLRYDKSAARPRVTIEHHSGLLRYLRDLADDCGAAAVLVELVFSRDAEAQRPEAAAYGANTLAVALQEKLACAAVRASFRSWEDAHGQSGGRSALFVDAWHPTREGHELYARAVLEALDSAELARPRR